MPRRVVDLYDGRPLLDIASYARPGPNRRDRLSPTEIDHIRRTVERVPEVMVKVLTKGGQNLSALRRHVSYLSRGGDLDIETDDGERASGKDAQKNLLDEWDLDLDERRRRNELSAISSRRAPKHVHKLMFSMPPGTPPEKVLVAVRNFAREEFALQHRYAMVLHTDEPHPHVHVLVKAVSEQGERLNIRKETLRRWRAEFARHLRALGVQANATERAVRGAVRTPKPDGIYRAMLRGQSTHMKTRIRAAAVEMLEGVRRVEPGKDSLNATRASVLSGWRAVAGALELSGHENLAARVEEFLSTMPPARTDNESTMLGLLRQAAHGGRVLTRAKTR